jgi:hypothetical protein
VQYSSNDGRIIFRKVNLRLVGFREAATDRSFEEVAAFGDEDKFVGFECVPLTGYDQVRVVAMPEDSDGESAQSL